MGAPATPFAAPGRPPGVLVLHGFTGSPASMRPLAERCADAGYAVSLPLLPGHGTTPEDLAGTTYADWLACAQRALVALAAQAAPVVAIGLSMGGSLCLDLARREPGVAALVLVNPFAEPPAESFTALLEAALATGATSVPSIGSDIAKPGVDGSGYAETPIAPMLSLAAAVRDLGAHLDEVTCPVLLFSSATDHVVPVSTGPYLLEHLAGPVERHVLESSYHVATLDHDAPFIEATTLAFLARLGATT